MNENEFNNINFKDNIDVEYGRWCDNYPGYYALFITDKEPKLDFATLNALNQVNSLIALATTLG